MRRVWVDEDVTVNSVGGTAKYKMPWYWLLTRDMVSGLDVFTQITSQGEVILPVFGSADDASDYLSEETGSWKARKTSRGELVSVLMGVCRGARWIVLDPPPRVTTEEALELCGLSRESFLEPLLGRGRSWFEEERNYGQRSGTLARGFRSQEARKSTVVSRKVL
jgi:hypothetical protein